MAASLLLGVLWGTGQMGRGQPREGSVGGDTGPAGLSCVFIPAGAFACQGGLGWGGGGTPTYLPLKITYLLELSVHALGGLGQAGDLGKHLEGGWEITSAPLQRSGFTVATKVLPVSEGLSFRTGP